jgi:hypothetical protein
MASFHMWGRIVELKSIQVVLAPEAVIDSNPSSSPSAVTPVASAILWHGVSSDWPTTGSRANWLSVLAGDVATTKLSGKGISGSPLATSSAILTSRTEDSTPQRSDRSIAGDAGTDRLGAPRRDESLSLLVASLRPLDGSSPFLRPVVHQAGEEWGMPAIFMARGLSKHGGRIEVFPATSCFETSHAEA